MKCPYLLLISFLLIFLLDTQQAAAQTRPVYAGLSNEEHLSFVGMTIPDLIEKLGPPVTVAVERGTELWQDDVVFQYNGADFYIFRNRIWQVRLASTHGISNGDRKSVVLLIFGGRAADMGDHVIVPVNSGNWPLMIRINFNNTEQVSAIYIYRSDY